MIETLGQPLTAEQVRQVLGIGINKVYRHAKEIGGVRIGKKWVFLRITERAVYSPATRLSPISHNEFSRT